MIKDEVAKKKNVDSSSSLFTASMAYLTKWNKSPLTLSGDLFHFVNNIARSKGTP